MKKILKKKRYLYTLLVCILLFILLYYNRNPLIKASSNWLSRQTIPFQLVVNPHKLDQIKKPKSLTLNELSEKEYQQQLKITKQLVNSFDKHRQQCGFLSTKQNQQLKQWVQQKHHRYLYSVTPLTSGKNRHGKYITVSVNRYDDTQQIHSYRYQVFYRSNGKVQAAKFIGNFHNAKPPKFISWTNKLGVSGIAKVPTFLDKVNTTLINSGITAQSTATLDKYQQLARNLGLSSKSATALKQYVLQNGMDQKNSSVVGYELSDVPRETRFFITQINDHHRYYYTVTFNRNQNEFTNFLSGHASVAEHQ
ncbi:hypothetical protein MOO45_08015 [Bombilactobacillus folatiphilus]|uniref:Uncharacterized protein n=1 Tax=Bombilactobacillus folatiphilus TaxID=2923362 RepID=A0ABY4P8R5_9LACO|nr:hypothetical protein [Bombilactobacillus folatiphilus]UQS82114.1 hypothetical protein MOO45_08015 [Bombilactobacillus folatiphilus]